MTCPNFQDSKGFIFYNEFFSNDVMDEIQQLSNFENLLPLIAENSDIFYTEDLTPKLIKQIQHLENILAFRQIGQVLLSRLQIKGEIVNMQLFIKHPNYKITRPHQDGAYFNSDKYLTFWIPLQDVDTSNSCLYYLENSHLDGLLPHQQTGSVVRNRTGVSGLSLEYKQSDISVYVPVEMKRGDIVVHHPFTLHYSSTNTTKETRISLTCIVKLH